VNNFLLERFPIHLETLQHGPPTMDHYLSFKESGWYSDIAYHAAGAFRAVDTESDVYTTLFALPYHTKKIGEIERLGSVKNGLGK